MSDLQGDTAILFVISSSGLCEPVTESLFPGVVDDLGRDLPEGTRALIRSPIGEAVVIQGACIARSELCKHSIARERGAVLSR